MNENAGVGGLNVDVMVVVAGDGEVPHPAVMNLGDGAAAGDRSNTNSGLDPSWLNLAASLRCCAVVRIWW
jgi:hypothetical protein